MDRPSKPEYFMQLARDVASRATCLRRQVGAVIVKDDQILSTGYNGSPKGMPHCDTLGCLREELQVPSGERYELCRSIHAEANAVIQAAHNGVRIAGSTMYVTDMPCYMCAKLIVNAGICEVWVDKMDTYDDKVSSMFNDLGIKGGTLEYSVVFTNRDE